MNPVVSIRAGGLGQLAPTRQQRVEAAQQITANLRARLLALSGQGVQAQADAAAKAAGAAAPVSTGAAAQKSGRTPTGDALDRDAFLLLLVQQMQNQDPLSPFDNTQMVAQLAQFAALEQMTNLNTSFDRLRDDVDFLNGNVDQLNFISGQSLLGRSIEGLTDTGEEISGVVDSVGLRGSLVVLGVGGQTVPMSSVIRVTPADGKGGKG